MDSLDTALIELGKLNEQTDKVLCRTRKLIQELDSEARFVKEHLNRVKTMLGISETHCTICFKDEPTHCLSECHHVFCHKCATKCIRPPRKCFVCRQPVTSIFKIYSS